MTPARDVAPSGKVGKRRCTRPCGQTTGSLRLNGARQQKNRRVACGIAKVDRNGSAGVRIVPPITRRFPRRGHVQFDADLYVGGWQ